MGLRGEPPGLKRTPETDEEPGVEPSRARGESVHDGAEAIQAYGAACGSGKPFDVVIMDLTIPGGMGGKEAVGKLLERDPQARVLVTSGYSNDPVMANYAEYGFVGALAKPISIQELADMLKRVLDGAA